MDKAKIRLKNVTGDAMILAASIVYLGVFAVEERMEARRGIAEKVLNGKRNVECGEYWLEMSSEEDHHKLFKKVVKDMYDGHLFNKVNHLIVEGLFSEFLFTLFFTPTLPVIYDSVGAYQDLLGDELENKVLFASDYMIQEKME